MMTAKTRLPVTIMLLAVLLTAAWLRLYKLPQIPPGLWFDEAYNALEAAISWQTANFPIFFSGNNGREPLFIYLLMLAGVLLGDKPFTLRIASAFIGIVTIPLLFRLAVALFKDFPYCYWLGVVAAAGLATSYWHVSVSRLGLRAIMFLPFLVLGLLLFVRGLHTRRYRYFIGAGVVLGLSQYTYLSARLVPLIFLLFGLIWLVIQRRRRPAGVTLAWRGIAAMGLAAGFVFLPLALFFWQQPDTFSARTGDIALTGAQTTPLGFANHLVESLRLFIDAAGTRWRYSLLTRPLLDWVGAVGFWVGVLALVRYLRRPTVLLLGCGLLVMWLPGLLSREPVHELRQAGILPFYYMIAAYGFVAIVNWLLLRRRADVSATQVGVIAVLLPLLLSGCLTFYDYFYRWAVHPEVYAESRGQTLDIARLAAELSRSALVILPFDTYAYPSARYLLRADFTEAIFDPAEITRQLNNQTPVILLGPADDWPPQNGLAWLTRSPSGQGTVYISHLLPQIPVEANEPAHDVLNKNNLTIGYRQRLAPAALGAMLAHIDSPRPLSVQFGDKLQLAGYNLIPPVIVPGGFSALDLYWQGVNTAELGGDLFIQLLALDGAPVNQFHEAPFSSQVSRWHWNALLPGRHLIWTGADITPGVYVLQVGLFDPATLARFDITANGQSLGDQLSLGLLYVSDGTMDPRQPANPLDISLANGVKLLGYSLPERSNPTPALAVTLYWVAVAPRQDYNVHLELLTEAGEIVAQADFAPLGGLYPTSRWQPGEVVVDPVQLPLPENLTPGTYQLRLKMYNATSGETVKVNQSGAAVDVDAIVLEVLWP